MAYGAACSGVFKASVVKCSTVKDDEYHRERDVSVNSKFDWNKAGARFQIQVPLFIFPLGLAVLVGNSTKLPAAGQATLTYLLPIWSHNLRGQACVFWG